MSSNAPALFTSRLLETHFIHLQMHGACSSGKSVNGKLRNPTRLGGEIGAQKESLAPCS